MRTLRVFFQCLVALVVVVSLGYNWRSLEASGLLDVPDTNDAPETPKWAPERSGNRTSHTNQETNTKGIERDDDDSSAATVEVGNTKVTVPVWKHASLKFFLLAPNEYTSNFLSNHTLLRASTYYQRHLNEESAEVWLHRGFSCMSYEQGQTKDSNEADVILIAGYFHLNAPTAKRKGKKGAPVDHSALLQTYETSLDSIHGDSLNAKSKPHLLLIPTWNPKVANDIGVRALAKRLKEKGISNLWSLGFERNEFWQGVPIERILPIPYVVRPDESLSSLPGGHLQLTATRSSSSTSPRKSNFVFYVGENRRDAKAWAGCHRDKLILPLKNDARMDVRLVTKYNRLNQSEYNYRMATSDYCLILCGDTPTSRSLTSAMVSGCIPIRVGSRLRGLCEPPCHVGYGWKPTGPQYPHLPFPDRIPWDIFPEVDEQSFLDGGVQVLDELFRKVDDGQKKHIRSIMNTVKNGWIYGWGDPVNSSIFGNATDYIWGSFVSTLAGQET